MPELSGPSELSVGLTPVTVNELLLIDPALGAPGASRTALDAGLAAARRDRAGKLHVVQDQAPAAPETSFRPNTVVTAEDLIAPFPRRPGCPG